ncbi:MAG: response regulator [Lachnospiraceae bacterium]|nr:response regulator [Lachnospiraceae bacterium]
MSEQRVIMLGEKQTFMKISLVNKIKEAKINCEFVPWTVDNINENWENTALVILYIDEGVKPPEDIVHFLVDKMDETGTKMIMIGEKGDVPIILNQIPSKLVFKTCYRPINNDDFTATVCDFMEKAALGEFKKRILVVDDNAPTLRSIKAMLEDKYDVQIVPSGTKAMTSIGKRRPDLILLDYEMPVCDGRQTLEMIRSEDDLTTIPVIFLTGVSDRAHIEAVLSLHPAGYMLKPPVKEKLEEAIEKALH